MSRIVRLYPGVWRERYGDEFAALLEARPPTFIDRLDIIRGALDERLRPQVRPSADDATQGRPTVASILAVAGGALFLVAAISLVSQGSPLPYRDAGVAQLTAWLGATLIVLGPMRAALLSGSVGSLRGTSFAAALLFATCIAGPWPILVVGVYGFALAALLVGLWRVATDSPVWLLVAVGALCLGLVNTEDERAWLFAAFGLPWTLIGIAGLAGRVSRPAGPTAMEAPAR
jgi:hypothetical protein